MGRQSTLAGRAHVVEAFVALLQRGLGLDRLLFLVDDGSGRGLRCVGRYGVEVPATLRVGDVPPGGPWSATLPIESNGGVAGQLLLGRPDGAPLPPQDYLLARQLAAGAGTILESAGLAADLDQARGLLQRADQLSALGTLAAAVAHEIRNPLVSVRTFIQLLPERLEDEEFRTGFRDLALREIERICELISDLLSFSRPTPAERELADFNEIAGQIMRLLEAEARRRDVHLVARFAELAPRVVAHEAQVKQVLMNIVMNAIQACPGHGTVEIFTRDDGSGGCLVEVADTGAGIATEHLDHVFEPFYTTKETGSGLGLYIAQRIVAEHGGDISARARAEGGTVFSVRFPRDGNGCHGVA